MAWERRHLSSKRYVLKVRKNRKVVSLPFKSEDSAHEFRQRLESAKQKVREEMDRETLEQDCNDRRMELLEIIVEQTLVSQGFIRRQGRWVLVRNLVSGLTREERNYVRRVKRGAVEPGVVLRLEVAV